MCGVGRANLFGGVPFIVFGGEAALRIAFFPGCGDQQLQRGWEREGGRHFQALRGPRACWSERMGMWCSQWIGPSSLREVVRWTYWSAWTGLTRPEWSRTGRQSTSIWRSDVWTWSRPWRWLIVGADKPERTSSSPGSSWGSGSRWTPGQTARSWWRWERGAR